MGELTGKVALVTGGNRGIGRAIAQTFATAGATVVIAARDTAQTATVLADLERRGRPGVYDAARDTVALQRLIYIGQTDNIRTRVAGHERWTDWRRYLRQGEQICFSAAPISPATSRSRVEAALIFRHKPPANSDYLNNFPFDRTTVRSSGEVDLLVTTFTIDRFP